MNMKLWKVLLMSLSLLLAFSSCDDDEDEELVGNWIELSDFGGLPRTSAVSFTIGERIFVGTGYNLSDRECLSDFWEYNVEKDSWSEVASFPGLGRHSAVAFSAGGKGYVGTGLHVSDEEGELELKDFYEYDPVADSWTEIAEFPGDERYEALAFSINDIGYVGTGYNGNTLSDFYAYNPTTSAWESKANVGGSKRRKAFAFVIDGIGYVGGGYDNGYEDDLRAYDPEQDLWIKKRDISDATDESFDDDYSGIIGEKKVTFTINGLGYVATGGSGYAGSTVWEYNPETDLWIEKYSLEGAARLGAVAFSYGDKGYIATGRSGSLYYDDVWGFEPNAEYDEYD